MDDPEEPQYNPSEFTGPGELAAHLTSVFRDEKTSNFEKTMAAVGLQSFWLGCEVNRIAHMATVVVPMDPNPTEPGTRMN